MNLYNKCVSLEGQDSCLDIQIGDCCDTVGCALCLNTTDNITQGTV